ncbi:magnesium transporter [Rhodococcus tukisamuensis]|uniref:Magnesium transporter n=1 Tax=Rhodococcus tukisamuensis TaxID=168276 RepID=A0A1G7CLE2_9NOCA|nr:magnesium and cobalt transport protein CorA [Rhodococcus tukisamuensis]SDE40139.1 magnesium transporter [Rhodococcus tukisamuensis]
MSSLPPRPHLPSLPQLPSFHSPQEPEPVPSGPPPCPEDAIVDCAVYVGGRRLPGTFTHETAMAKVRALGRGFVWVGLHKPNESQMVSVARCFGLHELMVEDAVGHSHQRPKLERYDDVMFMVLRTVNYVEHESITTANEVVETGEIMIFMGPDFVLTVRHGEHSKLTGVRQGLEANPELLALGPSAVLHAIADHVVDSYLVVTESVENDVDLMEEAVFSTGNRVATEQIYMLKREIVELRKSVNPLASPLQRLGQDTTTGIPKEVRRYLRDVQDHHTIVAERIAEFDEVLSTLVDAALAKIAVQQNTDMRKISAWVAIAAVPTMFAGVYGMNFEHMPELQWTFGYPLVLGIIAAICTALFVTFRRNDWL